MDELRIEDCACRLSLRERQVRTFLHLPSDDPRYLPHTRTPSGYLVAADDVERLAERLGLPADPIRLIDAIEILAGKRLDSRSTAYKRQLDRVTAEVQRGRLAVFMVGGQRRYSAAQVLTLKALHDDEGMTARPMTQRGAARARVKRADREELINVEDTAKLAGVEPATVRLLWTPRSDRAGKYGATKIDGRWFFKRELVQARSRRSPPAPRMQLECASCGTPIERPASKVRRAQRRAEEAGRTPVFLCAECLVKPGARSLRVKLGGPVPRKSMSQEGRASFRRVTAAAWEAGVYNRSAQSDLMRRVREETARSPMLRVRWVSNWYESRWGKPLPTEIQERHARRARSRAQTGVTEALDARVIQLWSEGLSGEDIAEQLRISSRRFWRMHARLKLPRRRPGRRPLNKY